MWFEAFQVPQNGCLKKTKHANFPKTNIFYPLIRTRTYAYQGGKKCSFFGKLGVLCFLETPVLRFVLLPYYPILSLRSRESFYLTETPTYRSLVFRFNSELSQASKLELFVKTVNGLAHSFPMHPFSTPWKHQENVSFSAFRG